MKFESDHLVFRSGRKVYTNNGVIGIFAAPAEYDDDPRWDAVSYGGDGGLWIGGDSPLSDLTPAEAIELADAMLKRWAEFRSHWVDVYAPVLVPKRDK